MPISTFKPQGIVKDIDPQELSSEVWSGGNNVRSKDGAMEKLEGHSQVFGATTVAPHALLQATDGSNILWLYASTAKVYTHSPSGHTNITRQSTGVDVDYTGAATDRWSGGTLNGIPVITNGVDAPQMWNTPAASTKLADLTAWPASTTCRVMRPFKNFLVAMDVTKSGTRYPHLVKWSHSADPGAVPSSWDETDATKDAGENVIAQTPGYIIDALPMRDILVIYKEDSCYGMQYVGGQYIFRFYPMLKNVGVLAKGCIAEFEGKHLVLTNGDVIVHDGQQPHSILDKRLKKYLFNAIDNDNYANSFVTPNYKKGEIWICFPESGQTYATKALIWNWKDNTFGLRDLPGVSAISYGIISDSEDQSWNADSDAWNDDTTNWDERYFNPTETRLLMADPTNSKLFMADDTNQFDGTNMVTYVEREGLPLGGGKVDLQSIKLVKRIWPRIEALSGVVMTVEVGYQMNQDDPVSWDTAKTFTAGADKSVDCLVTGRVVSVRFKTEADVAWKLHGFDLEYEVAGRY